MAQHLSLTGTTVLPQADFTPLRRAPNIVAADPDHRFEMRFIEALNTCELSVNGKFVSMHPHDVIMMHVVGDVTLATLGQVAELTLLTEVVSAPSPLNLVVVGDNSMVHDLMNDTVDTHFIVYRELGQGINHRYFQLVTALEEQGQRDVFVNYQREMALGLLMTELLRHHRASISISDSYFPGKDIHHASADTQSGVIFNYLVHHSQDATLAATAAHFGYDKNYFSRLCRNLFDKTFTGQLAFIRIELAKRMLALSNKTIEEIAFELGYKNMSSYFALFKRSTGQTPKEWRDTHGYRSVSQ